MPAHARRLLFSSNPGVSLYAAMHKIEMLCFSGHSTHLLQPPDVGIFGPLGNYYCNEVDEWIGNHPYQTVNSRDFVPICQPLRRQAFTKESILSSFEEAAGSHPFCLRKVLILLRPPHQRSTSLQGSQLTMRRIYWILTKILPLRSILRSVETGLYNELREGK
jgi:hypothetical protein